MKGKTMNPLHKEKLKLVTSMLLFGTIGLFVRYINLPSSIIAFVRGLVGMLFLLAVILLRGNKIEKEAVKKNLLWLILSGVCLGMNWILLFEAYRFTTVATATLCYYLAPIIVIVVSPFLLKEKLTLRKLFCTIVALLGMVLVSGVMQNGIPALSEAKGILSGLGAAMLYAGIMLMNKKIQDISAYDKTLVQLGISAMILLPYCLLTEDVGALDCSPTALGMLLLVGIVHTGVTYFLYFGSMGHLNAQTVAIISYVDPVVAVLISIFVLGEGMNVMGIIGAVLVLGAAFISETGNCNTNNRKKKWKMK